MGKITLLFTLLLWSNLAVGLEAPYSFTIDSNNSALSFEAIQNNAPVNGTFKALRGEIYFHPNNLTQSVATIQVDLATIHTVYDEVITTLLSKEWFYVDQHPMASFKSSRFTHLAGKNYQLEGFLELKGLLLPLTLNFSLEEFSKEKAVAIGKMVVKRLDYNVGWQDTAAVKNEVQVDFDITAKKAENAR